jgi:hypothetical protein
MKLYHVILSCVFMEGMSSGPILSERDVIGLIDSSSRGATGMDGRISSCTGASILEVLKKYLIVQIQSHVSHTNNKYTTLSCDLLSTHLMIIPQLLYHSMCTYLTLHTDIYVCVTTARLTSLRYFYSTFFRTF